MNVNMPKVPQGQVVMNPNGDFKTPHADVDGLVVYGKIPGERGSDAHNVTTAICDVSTECDW